MQNRFGCVHLAVCTCLVGERPSVIASMVIWQMYLLVNLSCNRGFRKYRGALCSLDSGIGDKNVNWQVVELKCRSQSSFCMWMRNLDRIVSLLLIQCLASSLSSISSSCIGARRFFSFFTQFNSEDEGLLKVASFCRQIMGSR